MRLVLMIRFSGNDYHYTGNVVHMIRTGDEYRESLRDGREVWIDGEKVKDVPTHPAFKPIVDARARIYDLAHEPATEDVMSYEPDGERMATGRKPPRSQ